MLQCTTQVGFGGDRAWSLAAVSFARGFGISIAALHGGGDAVTDNGVRGGFWWHVLPHVTGASKLLQTS